MIFKGTYKQAYTVDGVDKELVVEVELHQYDGLFVPQQPIYYATATANNKEIKHKDLSGCVNAQFMADSIGKEIIQAWKIRAKKENKKFKVKVMKKIKKERK